MHVSILKIIMKNVSCTLHIFVKLESFVWGKFVISIIIHEIFSECQPEWVLLNMS